MNRQRSKTSPPVSVYLFQEDYEDVIKTTVLQNLNQETGGDLFGLWTNEADGLKPLVHIVLGPGRDCKRTSVSFFQDVPYLKRVGSSLANHFMLGHIGEWHSHHRLTLYEPSSGDHSTIRKNYPRGFHSFLLIIANILPNKEVTLSPYLYQEGTREVIHGKVTLIPGKSPFRREGFIAQTISQGAEGATPETPRNYQSSNTPALPPSTTDKTKPKAGSTLVASGRREMSGDGGIDNLALAKEKANPGDHGAMDSLALPDRDVEMPPDFWYRSEDRNRKLEDILEGIKRIGTAEEPFTFSFAVSGKIDKEKASKMFSKIQEIAGDEMIKLGCTFNREGKQWAVEIPAEHPRTPVTLQCLDQDLVSQAKQNIDKENIRDVFIEISRNFKPLPEPKKQDACTATLVSIT